MSTDITISIADFLTRSERNPVIDVRSPGEFAHGQIPGAHNVPLFSDEERAAVGTLYKQEGSEAAISLGMEYVMPRTEAIVAAVREIAVASQPANPSSDESGQDVLVHCWRGGMRSDGVAKLLNENGFNAQRLEGGYKAYRQAGRECFEVPQTIAILTGLSGAGKTQVLLALQEAGEQIIDLEGLANHRGSAFGGISQPTQPTQEQFENILFHNWAKLDPRRVVWIESESQAIGTVRVTAGIWEQMTNAPSFFLDVPQQRRLDFLMEQYGDLPVEDLESAMGRIKKRLGGERHAHAVESLAKGDRRAFALIALQYYDKAYDNAKAKCLQNDIINVPAELAGQVDLVPQLQELAGFLTSTNVS
jgi:tRNA 2-selenouridine synthase